MADSDTGQISEEPGIVAGSLTLGLVISVITCAILACTGHVGWSRGFLVGAGISLISLYSLGSLVPRLSMPTAPRASQFLLALLLFLKLPFYTVALYLVMNMPGVDARSAFPGIMVAPLAITGKAIGGLVWQAFADAAYRRQIRRGGSTVIRSGRKRVTRRSPVEPATDQG